MTRRARFYGKYRGTVINNVDPLQIGRIQAMVPDVAGLHAGHLGDALPADGRHQHRRLHGADDRLRCVDRVRARRSGLSDLGRRLLGQRGGGAGARACRCRPGVSGITIQTPLKNGIVVSDVPGPTGGILIQTTTGAMISVSDVGIIISNGKGAIINMTGPTVDVNLGALTVM